jgi:hypothetical protein
MLLVVLYGYEAWSLTFRDERSLKVLGEQSAEKDTWAQEGRGNR